MAALDGRRDEPQTQMTMKDRPMDEQNCLLNPDWEPTEAQERQLAASFERQVAWRRAMAARGIKVLALGLSPNEMVAEANRWWNEEGQALDK